MAEDLSGNSKGMSGYISMYFPWIVIFGYFLINLLVISPVGDFPLHDDWGYGYAVKHYLDTGKMDLVTSNACCYLHIYFGVFLSKIFGYSYTVLRSVNVVAHLISTVMLYLCARELGARRGLSTLLATCYQANPILLNLSYSFMTDITSLTFISIYMYALLKYLKRYNILYLLLGSLCLVASLAIRQTAFAFVLANLVIGIVLIVNKRTNVLPLILLFFIPYFSFHYFEDLMAKSTSFTDMYKWYEDRIHELTRGLLRQPLPILWNLGLGYGRVIFYLALFAVPVLASFVVQFKDIFSRRPKIQACFYLLATIVVTATGCNAFYAMHKLMPFTKNFLRIPNLGTMGIMGINIADFGVKFTNPLTWFSAFFAMLYLSLFFYGLYCLVVKFFPRLKVALQRKFASASFDSRYLAVFSLFVMLSASFAMFTVQSQFMDFERYYVVGFAPLLLCLLIVFQWLRLRVNWVLSGFFAVFFAVYATCGTQDFLSWNRARWQGIRNLEKQGISFQDIDGGAEYNLVREPQLLMRAYRLQNGNFDIGERGVMPRCQWRWWPIHGEKYIVSFNTIPEYDLVEEIPYFSMLTLSTQKVVVLKAVEK